MLSFNWLMYITIGVFKINFFEKEQNITMVSIIIQEIL